MWVGLVFRTTHLLLFGVFFFSFRTDAAGNSHSANVGIIAASLPTLRPIFKLMSGEKFSQFFSQLLPSKSRSSNPSKFGSKSLPHEEKKMSFKGPKDGNTVEMNESQTSHQAATLSNQKLNTSPLLSALPQNSVLVTMSFSHSIGSNREDLESGSLATEIYGNR